MSKLTRIGKFAAAASGAIALCGCALMPGAEPPKSQETFVFSLQQNSGSMAARAEGCANLLISSVTSAPGMHTAQMAYAKEANRLSYYAFARWADVPARMLEPLLLESLENSAGFANVFSAPAPVSPDLRLEARNLEVIQRFDGARNEVRVSVHAQLVAPGKSLLASQRFAVVSPIRKRSAAGGVQATNLAVTDLVAQLRDFVLEASASIDWCGL